VNVVDSSAWLEYFADGPNASFFATAIENVRDLLVPTVCIAEVFRRVQQQRGEDAAIQAVALMQQGQIISMDASLAVSAGRLGNEMKLPLADSIIFATAQAHSAILWTQDADFEKVPNVKFRAKIK
jgi:predicted nucleic acid-binding protein